MHEWLALSGLKWQRFRLKNCGSKDQIKKHALLAILSVSFFRLARICWKKEKKSWRKELEEDAGEKRRKKNVNW